MSTGQFLMQNLDRDWKKKLTSKYTKYKNEKKFTDNDLKYIFHIFRMEKDEYTRNKSGFLLILNHYSDDTLLKLKEFIEMCENKWKEQDSNKDDVAVAQFIVRREKKRRLLEKEEKEESTTSAAAAAVKEKRKRKVKILDDGGGEKEVVGVGGNNIDDEGGDDQKKLKTIKTKSIDAKRRPLQFYKGVYKRVMRCSRNASSNSAISVHNKKRTSDLIKQNDQQITKIAETLHNELEESSSSIEDDEDPKFDIKEEEEEEEEDIESSFDEIENEYSVDGSEEEEEEFSSSNDEEVIDGELDDISGRYK